MRVSRRGRRPAWVACLGALASLAIAHAAHAGVQPGGFGAQPEHRTGSYFVERLAPGAGRRDAIVVTSSSPTPLRLVVYPVDGVTAETSGAVYSNHGTRLHGAGRWLATPVTHLTLRPGRSAVVPFGVHVPAGTRPGDHLAGVAVQSVGADTTSGHIALNRVFRTVVGVLVHVPGRAVFQPSVSVLGIGRIAGTKVAAVRVQLGDTAGKLGKPTLNVTVAGDGYRRVVTQRLDTILPGDRIDYRLPWPDTLPAGRYTVIARVAGGARTVVGRATVQTGRTLAGPSTTRSVSPPQAPAAARSLLPAGIVLGAIVLALGAMLLYLHRRKRWRLLPPLRLPGWRARTGLLAATGTLVAAALLLGAASSKAAGSLANVTVTPSNTIAGSTNVNYTFSFTTASAENLTSITMTVPSGTSGTPQVGTLSFPYGNNPTGTTVSLSGTTLTFTFSAAFYVGGSSNVSIQITGLTNTSTPGSYTSSIQTIGPSYESYPVVDSGTSASFSLSGGALTNGTWNVTDVGVGATNVSYTYSFTTQTAGNLDSATMTVPSGTAGTPGVGTVSGVPAGGSASLSGTTLTYAFSSTSVAADTSVSITFTGLTNTSTPGSYSSSLQTRLSGTAIDTGTTGSVSFVGGHLSDVLWTVDNATEGATNVGYTYSLDTGTGAYLTSISMTVPAGTGGTPTIGAISSTYSTLPTNGTLTFTGTTLTYSFASTYLNPSYSITITVDGLTNTGTTGSYTSSVVTGGTGGPVDTGVSGSVTITGVSNALVSPIWSVSNTAVGATNVTYTYSFTTASAHSLDSVTMSVPPGTAGGGSIGVGTVRGVPSGGTATLASNTLTYSFASTSIAANTNVTIHITGLTNTATVGSYTAQLTTVSSGTGIDSGLTAAVSLVNSSAALTAMSWGSSSSTPGATGVTYTYKFTTATGASLTSVTMSVPPGTGGAPTISSLTNLPAGGTVSLASNTLTYAFTGTYVNPLTAVTIKIGGLTNTLVTGTYTTQIATKSGVSPVDTGSVGTLSISGGSLTNAAWTLSNASAGATNVTYTYRFTTGSDSTLDSVTMTVPSGTGGTPGLGAISGIPSGGAIGLSGTTLTYSFTPTEVEPSTLVTIHVTGMTNTLATGGYSSQIATSSSGSPVDTGTTATITIGGGTLVGPTWSIDPSSQSGATNVTYTYSFTTASSASLSSITMEVPPGTAGTPTVSSVTSTYSSLPTNGTIALADNTLTYSFTPTYINASYEITIEVAGMTNTLTPGSYTEQIATQGANPVDSGLTAAIPITGGTLTSAIWSVTSFATGATNVDYTYTFTTASSSMLDSVTMTVPPGTAGTPAVGAVSGVPSGGSVSLASNTLTYSFTATEVDADTAISIEITGMTNTTAVGSYQSALATNNGENPVDSGLTASVSISGGSLTKQQWTSSSYAAGHTGTAYSYSFTTGSGATLASITMTVPPGTSGTPAVGSVTSTANALPANGSVTLSSNTLTYSFAQAYVNPGYAITIQITGLTTTSSAGSYTSQVTTKGNPTPVDSGITPTVAIANGNPYLAFVVNSTDHTLSPLHAGTAVANAATAVGTAPQAIAFAPGGATAYVVDSSANTLVPVTVSSGAAGTAISLTGCTTPKGVAITPDGTKAYVTCSGNAKVVPVSLPGGSVGSAISVGSTPVGVAISPDGSTAYVVASGGGTLTPIATAGNTAGSAVTLSGCSSPAAIAIVPSGATAYVACSGSGSVLPVALPAESPGSAISVGTTPSALAVTPGGGTVYVANTGSGTVTPVSVSAGTAGTAISVGSSPDGIAISPDGSLAYVANQGGATVTPIRLSGNTALATIAVGNGPVAVAFAPDQAPSAAVSVDPGAAGSATSFDASASTVAYGTVASYVWAFGDGTSTTTSTPTVSHVYAAGCGYTLTLTETDSAGTSTTQVFTGQSASRNGGSSARTTASVGVTQTFGFINAPTSIGFSGSLDGLAGDATGSLALDVGDGTATSGWSISATSTTFSTGGATPHTLPASSVTVQTTPQTACDGAASCTQPTNAIAYPFVLPAGSTPPTAAKLFSAESGSGECDQTVSTTFQLAIPAGAYAGTYTSTWTITLSSGP